MRVLVFFSGAFAGQSAIYALDWFAGPLKNTGIAAFCALFMAAMLFILSLVKGGQSDG